MHCFCGLLFCECTDLREVKICGNSGEKDKEGVPEIQRPLFVVFIIHLISVNHGANLLN